VRWSIVAVLTLAACSSGAPQSEPPAVRPDAHLALASSINLFTTRVRARTVLFFEPGSASVTAACAGTAAKRVVADTMQEVVAHHMHGRSVEMMWDPRAVDDTTDHWVYGIWRITPSSPADAIQLKRDEKSLLLWAMRVSVDTMPHLHALAIADMPTGKGDGTWSHFGAADSACAGPPQRPRRVVEDLRAAGLVQP
jgi:hypothetical protein